MVIEIPDPALVLLVGPSGAGKSTFARLHFRPTEVVSSDHCRALISDDENDQSATGDAFELLHFITGKRLARRRLTVIDATNVRQKARRPLIALARAYRLPALAIVFDLPQALCEARNHGRAGRTIGPFAIGRQLAQLQHSRLGLRGEGFDAVIVLGSAEEVAGVSIARTPTEPLHRSPGRAGQ